jgi:hypothetical protein
VALWCPDLALSVFLVVRLAGVVSWNAAVAEIGRYSASILEVRLGLSGIEPGRRMPERTDIVAVNGDGAVQ